MFYFIFMNKKEGIRVLKAKNKVLGQVGSKAHF